MEKQQLVDIANTVMPFGKYKGRRLIDVPEEYLLWFARKDEFPPGKLGELMQSPDERGSDKLNELYRRVIALPSRLDGAKKAAETLRILVSLEREAFGMDKGDATGEEAVKTIIRRIVG